MAFSSPTQDFVVTSGLNVQGTATVTSSTGNTSTLQVAGGAAVAQNLIVGTTSQLYGDVTAFGNLTVKGTMPYLTVTGTSNLTVVNAGVSTATQLDIVTRLAVGGLSQLNNVTLSNSTNSTSSTTGALQVTGGVGIQRDLWVAGNAFVNGYQVLTTATVIASTLQAVTAQGSSTTYAISILNTASSTASVVSNALYVAGGIGAGSLLVDGSSVFNGNVIFNGTLTSVLTTNTIYTDNILDIHYPNNPLHKWSANDLKDIGFRFHFYDTDDDNAFLGRENSTGYLEWLSHAGPDSQNISITGTYGTFRLGSIILNDTTASSSTATGALTVAGGIGVGGAVYIANTSYVSGAQIITSATVNQFVTRTAIFAGTDTAVSTSTGDITVWNTSTLQSVTSRGNITTRSIGIANTSANTLTNTGNALYVDGGAWINKSLIINGVVIGTSATITQIYGNSGQYFGDANGFGALYAGIPTGFAALPSTVLQLDANINDYVQTNFQNINNGPKASTDWVATSGDGANFENFIDMGVTSGTWDGSQDGSIGTAVGPNDGYLYVQGNTSTVGQGNLSIGASSTGSVIRLFSGGVGTSAIVATINAPSTESTSTTTGAFILKGGAGISGNINAGGSITISSTASSTSTVTSNALYVAGGVGIAKSLVVTGPAIFQNNVTFSGATTYVYSTNTIYTDNIIELHNPGLSTSTWSVDDGKDIGFKIHYYKGGDQNAALILSNNSKYLEWYSTGVESTNTNTIFTSATYGIFKTGGIILTNTTVSNSTITGALVVAGGVGVGGQLYAGNMFSNGSQVITQVSLGSYGVSNLTAGTDTSVSTSTGAVIIWNTGTLQTVTSRGASSTSAISITNTTSSTSTTTGALNVLGGVGVGGALYAGSLYDTGNRVLTSVTGYGSTYIGVTSSSTGVNAVFTVTNLGVTNLSGTTYLSVSASTGSVTLTNLGVQTLTAGTDTSVSSNTGTIIVWNASTLQTVTSRGASTTNQLNLNNGIVLGSTSQNPILMNGTYSQNQPGFINATGTLIGTTTTNVISVSNYQHTLAPVSTTTIVNFYGHLVLPTLGNTATYTNMYGLFARIDMNANATTGTVGNWVGFVSEVPIRNAASDVRFTNHYGFKAQDPNTITATNVIGYLSNIAPGSASVNKWNFYAGGTAPNYFAGVTSIGSITASTGTTTGALVVAGGVGIGGNLNVGGVVSASNMNINGSQVLTSANIGSFGVTSLNGTTGTVNLIAGTDTAISTATGAITIWDTSTLQTVTGRGASTTNQLNLNNGIILGSTAQYPILMNGNYTQNPPGFITAIGTLIGTTASTQIYAFNYQHILAPVTTATIASYYGQLFLPTLGNTATYTNMHGSYARIDMNANATTGTVGTWVGFTSEPPIRNAASDVRFTNHYGFRAQDPSAITATNVIGFASLISSAGGGTRYNIYASGSAQNRFTGWVGIGKDPTVALDVVGQVLVSNTLTVSSTVSAYSTTTGALQVVGGIGVGDSVYVGNRVGFVNTGNVSTVYQYYNAATNSLDTVFG